MVSDRRSRHRSRSQSMVRDGRSRRSRSRSRSRIRHNSHGVTHHACFDPPLPTVNAQLHQLEEQDLSYSNNASHFNENDAVGALMHLADTNGGHIN